MHYRAATRLYACSLSGGKIIHVRLAMNGAVVSPTGCVYSCLNYCVGNIRKQPLRELWNGERYRRFRKRISRTGFSAIAPDAAT
jgi:hypothetical protein